MACWYVLLQGCIMQPKTTISKIIFLTWIAGSMILFVALQSQLISILTKPLYEEQLSNIKELAESSKKHNDKNVIVFLILEHLF